MKLILGVLLGMGGLALAQTISRSLDLRVNGAAAGKAFVIGGQAYVPVAALKPFNITVTQSGNSLSLGAQGGANQVAALEGCVGETLFNGVTRLTVRSVDEITFRDRPAWGITVEVRNGVNRAISLFTAGVRTTNLFIAGTDGNPKSIDGSAAPSEAETQFTTRSLTPGGSFTYQIKFPSVSGAPEPRPSKFIMIVDVNRASRELKFSSSDPSFRVNLDCQK